MRRPLLLPCVITCILGALVAAPAAPAYEVDLALGKTQVENTVGDRCSYKVVLPFSEVPGAIGYRWKGLFAGWYNFSDSRTPGNWHDSVELEGKTFTAPAGQHWFGATSGSGPAPCGNVASAWEILEAKAIMPDPVIKGKVLKADGTPAGGTTVKITAPNGSTFTRPVSYTDGSYSTWGLDPLGSYKVEVVPGISGEFCVAPASSGCTLSATRSVPPDATVDFVERTPHVVGTVVAGTDGTHPNDVAPAAGVPVTVSGKTKNGATLSWSTKTDAGGAYEVPVRIGEWDVTFPDYACIRDVTPCTQTKHVATPGSDTRVRVDAVARAPELQTLIEAPDVKLEQSASGWVEKTVPVKITVRNNGKVAASSVTLAYDDLQIGTSGTPLVPELPLKAAGPPARKALGAVPPGGEQSTTIPLKVWGDGKYDLSTAAVAVTGDGRTLLAPGRGTIKISGKYLHEHVEFGKARASKIPGFVQGGTTFTIRLELRNRSYAHRAVVDLGGVQMRGNAFDGHPIEAGSPIPDLKADEAVAGKRLVLVEPRDRKDFEYIVRTTSSDAFSNGKSPPGGTRATVTLPEMVTGFELTREGDVGDDIGADQIFPDGERKYVVPIDDSAPVYEQYDFATAASYFAWGALRGVLKYTAGSIKGALVGVRDIARSPFWLGYYTAKLYDSMRNDPKAREAFLAKTRALVAAAYPPELWKKLGDVNGAINKAVEEHYTKLMNEVYAGDWKSAVTTLAEESTEGALSLKDSVTGVRDLGKLALSVRNSNTTKLVGDYAKTLAPGALTRFTPAFNALKKAHEADMAEVLIKLRRTLDKRLGYTQAIATLKKTVKAGYELKDAEIRGLFGYTERQARALRHFVTKKGNVLGKELLLCARSRAAESVEWLARGAVLKGEDFKAKNVAMEDLFLGFGGRMTDAQRRAAWEKKEFRNLGRMAVADIASMQERVVKKRMRAAGLTDDMPEWQAILARREARMKEALSTEKGMVRWMEKAAKEGKVTMRWNALDNGMDPTRLKVDPTTYKFRLRHEDGVRIPEIYAVDDKGNGKWRSITGDMDLLQLSNADGTPLTDGERAKLYIQLASSSLGLLHPETATWIKKGLFNFAAKINEFVRSDVIQFAPDGKARKVEFIKSASYFRSKSDYQVMWDGGFGVMTP